MNICHEYSRSKCLIVHNTLFPIFHCLVTKGTGKSTVIYHIIRSFLPPNEVTLACCVQNKAVDSIAEKLVKCRDIPFFVVGNENRLGLLAIQWTLDAQIIRHPRMQRFHSFLLFVEALIGMLTDFFLKKIRVSKRHYDYREKRARELFPKNIEKRESWLGRDLWHLYWVKTMTIKYKNLLLLIERLKEMLLTDAKHAKSKLYSVLNQDLIAASRAILCTVATASRSLQSEEFESIVPRINTAILDEAGTCPEGKIPLLCCLPGLTRIIAIGDHKQLAPFSYIQPQKGIPDQEKGYFQRVVAALSGVVPMLREQYRMHHRICEFVSKQFYGGILVTPAEVRTSRCKSDREGIVQFILNQPHSTTEQYNLSTIHNAVERVRNFLRKKVRMLNHSSCYVFRFVLGFLCLQGCRRDASKIDK